MVILLRLDFEYGLKRREASERKIKETTYPYGKPNAPQRGMNHVIQGVRGERNSER